ncbi:MAG: Y_Y_Y domain protein [Methanomassiliicoccales archaeon PtaU1.Bin030]|nr:MAG: Y_Y_Y domain protein [Methanomassiliicoccales archaeon PtaU1.Bin030]
MGCRRLLIIIMCASVLLSSFGVAVDGRSQVASAAYADMDRVTSEIAVASAPRGIGPLVTITSPSEGFCNNTGNVTVTWEAASSVSYFEVSLDGASAVNVSTNTSITFDALEEGGHNVNVTAYNIEGYSLSDEVNFIVDMTVPVLTITYPAVGAWYNVTTINATWTATDPGSGIHNTSVSLDGGGWITVTDEYYEITSLADGQHNLSVRVYDNADNVRTSTKTFNINTVPPTVYITDPSEAELLSSATVIATWEGDPPLEIANYWVSIDGGAWTDVDMNTSHTFTILSEGEHEVSVKASDYAGNMNTSIASFFVDSISPEVLFSSPNEGARIGTNALTVEWTMGETGSGIANTLARVDEGSWFTVFTTLSLTALEDGTHTVVVRSTDNAGNFEDATLTFVVDTVAPTVTGTPTGTSVPIASTVGAAFSEAMDQDSVIISVNGVTGTLTWNGNTAIFTPSTSLGYSTTYSVTVEGRDLAGNEVSESWSFTTMSNEGSISGTVRDPDGNLVENATVTLSNGQITTTDAYGRFVLTNVSAGNYTLEIIKAGFPTVIQNVEIGAGQESNLGSISFRSSTAGGDDSNGTTILAASGIMVVAMVAFLLLAGRRLKK